MFKEGKLLTGISKIGKVKFCSHWIEDREEAIWFFDRFWKAGTRKQNHMSVLWHVQAYSYQHSNTYHTICKLIHKHTSILLACKPGCIVRLRICSPWSKQNRDSEAWKLLFLFSMYIFSLILFFWSFYLQGL